MQGRVFDVSSLQNNDSIQSFFLFNAMSDNKSASTHNTSANNNNTTSATKTDADSKDYMLCSEEKERHDQCFHRWLHEKFLKGEAKQDDCASIWIQYEECIKVLRVELLMN